MTDSVPYSCITNIEDFIKQKLLRLVMIAKANYHAMSIFLSPLKEVEKPWVNLKNIVKNKAEERIC